MHEIELKFQVGVEARETVERAVRTASARRTRLQARYFDTADHALAAAGIALRLRKEGRQWVQTLKAAGSDAIARLEHNVNLGLREPTAPDVQLHAGSPAGDALASALASRDSEPAPRLLETFRTDVWRTHRVLRVTGGGGVELAFDRGRIVASERELPVCELEIELLHGARRAVVEASRRWVARHGVWLDVRTKAERGARLALDDVTGSAIKAGESPWRAEMTVNEAWRAAVHDCLTQVLANASQIASGDYTQEHVHQLRVGVRRVRSVLRFVREWVPESAVAWDEALSKLSVRFGATRDRDVMVASLEPTLKAAGAPSVQWPAPAAEDDPSALLRASETNLLWLDLLGAADDPGAGADESPSIVAHASQRLRSWHRKVVADWKAFPDLADEARHTVRKRAKRLRYAAEFAAPLYPTKAVERYLKRLRPLQESLGAFNDLCVAHAAYRALVDTDPHAWFVLGWIAARREVVLAECARTLRRFAGAKPFWGKG